MANLNKFKKDLLVCPGRLSCQLYFFDYKMLEVVKVSFRLGRSRSSLSCNYSILIRHNFNLFHALNKGNNNNNKNNNDTKDNNNDDDNEIINDKKINNNNIYNEICTICEIE